MVTQFIIVRTPIVIRSYPSVGKAYQTVLKTIKNSPSFRPKLHPPPLTLLCRTKYRCFRWWLISAISKVLDEDEESEALAIRALEECMRSELEDFDEEDVDDLEV